MLSLGYFTLNAKFTDKRTVIIFRKYSILDRKSGSGLTVYQPTLYAIGFFNTINFSQVMYTTLKHYGLSKIVFYVNLL